MLLCPSDNLGMTRVTRWLSDIKMLRLVVGMALLLFVGGDQPREGKRIKFSKDSNLPENSAEKVNKQLNNSALVSPQKGNSISNSSTEQPFVITTTTTTREERSQRNSKLLLHLPRLEGETNVTFSDVQQEMVSDERMVRIGDGKYVPFNSMTFSSRNQALQAGVTEAGDTSTRTTTVPWWKKLKNNKKKGNKNKKWWNKKNKNKNKFTSTRRTTRPTTRPTERSTPRTTTRATKRPTKLSTTWFPLTFTSSTTKSADYFRRPVVHEEDDNGKDKDDKPAEAVIQDEHDDFAEEDNVLKDALVNSIFTNHNEEETEETGMRQLPTLTEVAGLFDDFYSYAEYYPWKSDVGTVKKFFLKILEDFSDKKFTDRRKLMKFLQKKVYLYSRLSSSAMNKLILDEELFQRYNFIVTDLVKRKIRLKSPTTKTAAKRDPSSEKPQAAHKNLLIMNNRVVLDAPLQQKVTGDKSVIDKNNRDKSEAQKKYNVIKNFFGQKRPVVDLGPYWSSERPALRPVQFYPQTSGWPEGDQGQGVEINPMFGQKPFGQESEVAELLASSGVGETGTGNTSCRVSLPS